MGKIYLIAIWINRSPIPQTYMLEFSVTNMHDSPRNLGKLNHNYSLSYCGFRTNNAQKISLEVLHLLSLELSALDQLLQSLEHFLSATNS